MIRILRESGLFSDVQLVGGKVRAFLSQTRFLDIHFDSTTSSYRKKCKLLPANIEFKEPVVQVACGGFHSAVVTGLSAQQQQQNSSISMMQMMGHHHQSQINNNQTSTSSQYQKSKQTNYLICK